MRILIVTILLFVTSCYKDWSYKGFTGPKYWGNLQEDHKFCKIGYNQSPINIKSAEYEFKKQDFRFSYSSTGFTKQQDPHSINFYFDRKDYVKWRGKEYYLQTVKFHHPSEHHVDNEQHVLEMQIFHKSDSEQIMILGVFIDIGEENAEFNNFINVLEDEKQEDVWGDINLLKIVKKDKLFFYDGSLTTPPCIEGIKWYIAKTPIIISKEQANKIIKLSLNSKANARPVQQFHPELY